MIFGNPTVLWLTPIILLILLLGFWGWQVKKNIVKAFKLDEALMKKSQIRKYIVAGTLTLLLIMALALPKLPVLLPGSPGKTGEIILLVDVSRSMAAKKDLNGLNRLERVKPILLKIVDNFPEAEISLHGFTGMARSHTPFTKDQFYLRKSITRVLDINSVPGSGTSYGQAILDVLDKFSANKESKLIVLFSDGEAFRLSYRYGFRGQQGATASDEKALDRALRRVAQEEIKVITVGVGEKEGATIPLYDEDGKFTGEYAKHKMSVYVSYFEEKLLRKIASQTDGRYFFETDHKKIISQIERNLTSGKIEEREEYQDISYLFLIPVAVLWMIFARQYFK